MPERAEEGRRRGTLVRTQVSDSMLPSERSGSRCPTASSSRSWFRGTEHHCTTGAQGSRARWSNHLPLHPPCSQGKGRLYFTRSFCLHVQLRGVRAQSQRGLLFTALHSLQSVQNKSFLRGLFAWNKSPCYHNRDDVFPGLKVTCHQFYTTYFTHASKSQQAG